MQAAALPQTDPVCRRVHQIWSKSRLHEDGGRWVPIVLANGTHVETGKRIITAPVKIEPSVFEDTYDFYRLAPAPIRASTAVLNSARFTVVSPPGRLVRDGDKNRTHHRRRLFREWRHGDSL